jgi:hypothetical protein
MSFLADEQVHVVDKPDFGQGQAQIPYQPVRPALPYERPETVVDWINQSGGTHKDKPVVEIPLKKNDKDTWEY